MSDFVQTMKDWRRMCAAMSEKDEYTACDRCRLQDFGCPAIYETDEEADWAHVESVVTKWAAENPVKQYPTWGNWLAEIGLINWQNNGEGEYSVMFPTFKMCEPIPAEIAQKLGIEPKEG